MAQYTHRIDVPELGVIGTQNQKLIVRSFFDRLETPHAIGVVARTPNRRTKKLDCRFSYKVLRMQSDPQPLRITHPHGLRTLTLEPFPVRWHRCPLLLLHARMVPLRPRGLHWGRTFLIIV